MGGGICKNYYLCKTITKNTYPTPNTKQHT